MLIHVDVWQKPTQYSKAIILQLKKNRKKEYAFILIEIAIGVLKLNFIEVEDLQELV